MRQAALPLVVASLVGIVGIAGVSCAGGDGAALPTGDASTAPTGEDGGATGPDIDAAPTDPSTGPAPGYSAGKCAIPAGANLEDTSAPRTVVGDGTAASCTSEAVVAAVAKGGVITFQCGPDPVTIVLKETAKIFNDTGPKIVIDGGGKVTLSGGGKVRILYMNTCDEKQKWTTSHCQDQDSPLLTVQNMTFVDGFVGGTDLSAGGGAIYARGGRLKVVNSRFFSNRCEATGQDVGGGAIRAFSQSQNLPVYIVKSTFGGAPGLGNRGSNGGALSSIGVSYTVINSLFTDNEATGNGANPAKAGTPGGGNGGAIANDGNTFTLDVCGSRFADNRANEGGGAIFFVSNDRTGHLKIADSLLERNKSVGFETSGFPGIFVLAAEPPTVVNSVLTP